MPTFAYIAIDGAGRRVKGRLDSASESALLAELSSKGLSPIQISLSAARRTGGRVGVRALAGSYRQLSELLR